MIPRWLLRAVLMGLVFAFFHYVLDRFIDPALLRGLEIAAILVFGATLAATGAAIGAEWIAIEGEALDWLLFTQTTVLTCIVFRLLANTIDGTLLRGMASMAIVAVGAVLASGAGSILAGWRAGSRRTP